MLTTKKTIIIIISLITVVALFVIADFNALFGTNKQTKLDFIETRFRTLDAETGALIIDVGVRCFQKNNDNACTRRDSHRAGIVSVHMPVRRVIERSILFKQSEEFIKTADPKLHMMFIHKDYYSTTKSLFVEDIYEQKENEYSVKMSPRKWEETEENDE